MKRAFLVTGPESAGNRLLASVLVRAGCQGTASTDSPFTDRPPTDEDPVVLIRSLPHGGAWPQLGRVMGELHARGYRVTILVTAREPAALYRSQVAAGHQPSLELARAAVRRAYRKALDAVEHADEWHLVPVEGLMLNQVGAVRALLAELGLPTVTSGPFVVDHFPHRGISDENAKHYEAAS